MTENAAFYLRLAQAREDAAKIAANPKHAERMHHEARRYRAIAARLERLETHPDTPRTPRERGLKLSAAQAEEIIRAAAAGERHAAIAARYGVHPDTVSRIYRRDTWPDTLPDVPRPKIEKRSGINRR